MSDHLNPTPVVLVEPRHRLNVEWFSYIAGRLTVGFAFTFLLALIAWWLGPLVFGEWYSLGYWQSFALIFFLRAVVPRQPGVRMQSNLRSHLP